MGVKLSFQGWNEGWVAPGLLAVLGLAAVLAGLAAAGVRQVCQELDRETAACRLQADLLAEADLVRRDLAGLFGAGTGVSWPEWQSLVERWADRQVRLREVSSLFNPNWLDPALLAGPAARWCWLAGVEPASLVQDRLDQGLSMELTPRYAGWFSAEFLAGCASPWADFNLNLACVASLEQVYGLMGADPAASAALGSRLRNARVNQTWLDEALGQQYLGPHAAATVPLLGCRQPVNLNLCEPRVLELLVHSPALGLARPEAVLEWLLARRAQGFVAARDAGLVARSRRQDGRRVVGGALLDWLGDESTHLEACWQRPGRGLRLVWRLVRPAGKNTTELRLAWLEWLVSDGTLDGSGGTTREQDGTRQEAAVDE